MTMPRKKPFSHKKKKAQLLARRQVCCFVNSARSPGGLSTYSGAERRINARILTVLCFKVCIDPVWYLVGACCLQMGYRMRTELVPAGTRRHKHPGRKAANLRTGVSHDYGSSISLVRLYDRYALQFGDDTRAEINRGKKSAQRPLQRVPNALTVSMDTIHPHVRCQCEFQRDTDTDVCAHCHQPKTAEPRFSMPLRPDWTYDMGRDEVLQQESSMFKEYMRQIHTKGISYYEQNLETWRQLWRVIELSDVIMLVVRHPVHSNPH